MSAPDLSAVEPLNPRFEPEIGLLILDLDHGKANEMGSAQLDAFDAVCALIESDASIRCLLTTSSRTSKRGTPIFIAGANVTERVDWDDDRVRAHVRRQRALMVRLRRLPIFTVVLCHGVTLGWGVEFVLTADTALATDTASFALPETGLGIIPGARGTAELASVVGVVEALRLGCLGERIDTVNAHRIGLVQERVADLDAGLERAREISRTLATRSPTAIAQYKRALLNGIGHGAERRLDLEGAAYDTCVDSGEAAIGRSAFSEIRAGKTPAWGPRRV